MLRPLARSLLLLLVSLQLAILAVAAGPQKQQLEGPPRPATPVVPGQAFHDWRSALIAKQYSSSNNSSSSGGSGSGEWVNIVARRESLSELKGPPARSTTHPAAGPRLQLAKALLAVAAADADAAARAAAAEALQQADAADVATLPSSLKGDNKAADAAVASGAGGSDKQQQQQHALHPADFNNKRRLLAAGQPADSSRHESTRSADSSSTVRSLPTASTPIARGVESAHSPGTTAVEQEQLQRLTQLMRAQPYKPVQTKPAQLESTLLHFVHRGPLRLYVKGQEWLLKGMDVPETLQLAAGGPQPRSQLLYLLDRAQTLGLNSLRFMAFADGAPGVGSATPRQWSQQDEEGSHRHIALQPAPGILNGTMLREGLDWLVHECGLRGIRLLPVLTNGGSTAGGGMRQYIDWIDPALTVTDFYKNDTIKSVFLDYVAAMLGHVSSLSGLPLREDPLILGWQLAEDASHPGTPSSQALLAWLRQFGVYVKQRAPHQLLLTGVKDLFGHNSPHHLQYNPRVQVFDAASHSPHVYEPRCHGVDFWLHNQMLEVDALAAGVFPDMHVACNATCKLGWTREWIRAHLRDALRMNKPLILGGVGALRPHSWRLQVLRVVQEEVQRALKYRHPIGGFIMSGLSHPDMSDTTGWGTYYSSKGVNMERPPLDSLNAQAVSDVEWRSFLNYDAFLTCQAQQTRGSSNDKGEASNTAAWVDGWDDVVRAVADLGALPDAWQASRAAA